MFKNRPQRLPFAALLLSLEESLVPLARVIHGYKSVCVHVDLRAGTKRESVSSEMFVHCINKDATCVCSFKND